jgi:long-chain fatty acid transport protein
MLLVAPAASWAAGLINYENGTPIMGMAAAGYAAVADDASTAFNNPAGMTRIKGNQAMFGLQTLYADVQFKPAPSTNVAGNNGDNAGGVLPMLAFFGVYGLSDNVKLGLAVNSYFGGILKYDESWVGRYYNQQATLVSVSVTPSVAFKAADWLSIGGGPNILISKYKTKTAVNNAPLGFPNNPDGQLEVDTYNTGVGGNFGVLLTPTEGTRIGLNWLTEVKLKYSSDPECTNVRNGPLINASGLCSRTAELDVHVPQQVMLSAYHEVNDRLALTGNIGWQQWSRFGETTLTIPTPNPTSITSNVNYNDTWHYAVGAQYKLNERWLLMGGVAYDTSPADLGNRVPSAPFDWAWRFGAGARYAYSDAWSFGASFEYIQSGAAALSLQGPVRGTVQGEYSPYAVYALGLYARWTPK